MAGGYARDSLGKLSTHYTSAADALLVAISELKVTGGGIVWIHRQDCIQPIDDEECLCLPVSIEVEPELSN